MSETIAWAAGLYDGEGSTSSYFSSDRKSARLQMQISQGGVAGTPPAVLIRFRDAIGHGNVTGPYRGYLYYWKTTRRDAIAEVATALWPYLSREKRTQLTLATVGAGGDPVVSLESIRSPDTERAWAAGLFDAEGSIFLRTNPRGRRWLELELPQSSIDGIPETLARFHDLVRVGAITGPRIPRNAWSKLPQFRWRTAARGAVTEVVLTLWPYLGKVSRERILPVRGLLGPVAATLSDIS